MSRLRKLRKLEEISKSEIITKTASSVLELDHEILGSGDVIGLSARIVNWNPWYQVYIEYDVGNSSSFYDGPNSEAAYKMYLDLLIAFKGISRAERFSKQIPLCNKQVEQFVGNPKNTGNTDYYHNIVLKKPSFLGYPV
ncbi:hypothetical protein D3C87_76220 [compost metagenome]